MAPAQTSGGVFGDCRKIAVMLPSLENDAAGVESVPMNSSPLQTVCGVPPAVLTVAKIECPSAVSANIMWPASSQYTAEGEALRLGVRLRALPPLLDEVSTGTTKTSPPLGPSSLIRPSMKATFLPSGETCGPAICSFGL